MTDELSLGGKTSDHELSEDTASVGFDPEGAEVGAGDSRSLDHRALIPLFCSRSSDRDGKSSSQIESKPSGVETM